MKERLLAGLFGLLLSNAGAAADFLVEVRVLVQRGCILVTQAREQMGRITHLVNNAGGAGPNDPLTLSVERFEEISQMKPEVFEKNFRKFKLLFNPDDLEE